MGLLARLRENVATTQLPQLQRGQDKPLEEGVTQAERDDAFPDGSYPIRTQKQADDAWDLRNNSKNHSEASVVSHIRGQVKKHDLKMPGQTREAASLRLRIREATLTKTGNTYEVTIVREGPGNPEDRNYYTRHALQEAVQAGLFEGLQAYADHPTATEERDRPERSVRHLVGHFREARYIDGTTAEVRAKFVPVQGPGYEWVTSLIESALSAPQGRPLIGISIDGYGHAPDQQEINGRTYNMVREVTHLGSADIVTRAGAGGQFHRRLQEAWRTTGPAERRPDTSKEARMKPAKLQETVKAAVAKLEQAAGLGENEGERADTLVNDAITSLKECSTAQVDPEIEVRIQEKIVEKPVAASDDEKDQIAARLRETEVKLTEADTERKQEKQRRKDAEARLQEVEQAKLAAKVLREASVSEKTARSWFDELVSCDDEQAMRHLVERRKAERDELLAELRESFGVEGAGPRAPSPTGTSAGDSAFDRLGIDPADYGLQAA